MSALHRFQLFGALIARRLEMLEFLCLAQPVGFMSGCSLTLLDAISGERKHAFA